MKRDNDTVVKNWRQPKYVLLVFLFFIVLLMGVFTYLSLSDNLKVMGEPLKKFANNRITIKKELIAKRGTIYDSEENILANNVTSYTLIAYLDSSRDRKSVV